jgi:hypothetical protein
MRIGGYTGGVCFLERGGGEGREWTLGLRWDFSYIQVVPPNIYVGYPIEKEKEMSTIIEKLYPGIQRRTTRLSCFL